MKRKLLIFVILFYSLFQSYHAVCDPVEIVVFYNGEAEYGVQLEAVISDFSEYNWNIVVGELYPENLTNAKMLITVNVDPFAVFSESEKSAIASWLSLGDKTLWISGDSDYGDDHYRQIASNDLLDRVDCTLRLEQCSVEDPSSNAGGAYRVLGIVDYCDSKYSFLTEGVEKVLLHAPGVVTAYSENRFYDLEEEKPSGVYKVITTTMNGTINNHNSPAPESHEINETGNFVLLALEVNKQNGNRIILSGDAPFGHMYGMYKPELINYERYTSEYQEQGNQFFENLIRYGTNEPPIANVNGPYSGLEGEQINFDSTGSFDPENSGLEYLWDFGDGAPKSNEANPVHSYQSAGTYTVSLTVLDEYGIAHNDTIECIIQDPSANIPPIAEANGPYSVIRGENITFDSTGSYDPDGTIINYIWSFGDSNQSYNPNPVHSYTKSGIYTITLTIEDDKGDSHSDTAICIVTDPVNPPNISPTANANGPYTSQSGSSVQFSSVGSLDTDGTIVEYEWSFGDGSGYYYLENPSHVYAKSGIYTVSLKVTDDKGLTNIDVTTINVIQPDNIGDSGDIKISIELIAGILSIGGAIVGIITWVSTSQRERKKKKVILNELLGKTDEIYARFKMNAQKCETELIKLKDEVITEFKQGNLEPDSFTFIDNKIDKYINEIREEMKRD